MLIHQTQVGKKGERELRGVMFKRMFRMSQVCVSIVVIGKATAFSLWANIDNLSFVLFLALKIRCQSASIRFL